MPGLHYLAAEDPTEFADRVMQIVADRSQTYGAARTPETRPGSDTPGIRSARRAGKSSSMLEFGTAEPATAGSDRRQHLKTERRRRCWYLIFHGRSTRPGSRAAQS